MTDKKMNPVVHFELPAENMARMKDFYIKAFGWEANQMGEEMGNYVVVMTTESTDKGPLKPGAINGGFYQKNEKTSPHPSFVISVDNIHESMKKVRDSGGKIQGEPQEIPGVGTFVSFIDTEGNRLSILQPLMQRVERGDNMKDNMIIVRDVFTAKPGMASKLAKLFKKIFEKDSRVRVMTDVVGDYNTVVMEFTLSSLEEYEKEMEKYAKGEIAPEQMDLMKGYTDMYVSGRREILKIVE